MSLDINFMSGDIHDVKLDKRLLKYNPNNSKLINLIEYTYIPTLHSYIS